MRFKFTNTEIRDLFLAWLLLSIAFSILMPSWMQIGTRLWISAVTVGLGFLLHELGHKFVAQHFGKFAEFRANLGLLAVSVLVAFTGMLIAAPGAVVISGFVSKKENGLIAAAGPIVNIVLALAFLPVFFLSPGDSVVRLLAGFGVLINASLTLFNLLPFWIFDGAKVINWHKGVYAILVTIGVFLSFIGTQIFPS